MTVFEETTVIVDEATGDALIVDDVVVIVDDAVDGDVEEGGDGA